MNSLSHATNVGVKLHTKKHRCARHDPVCEEASGRRRGNRPPLPSETHSGAADLGPLHEQAPLKDTGARHLLGWSREGRRRAGCSAGGWGSLPRGRVRSYARHTPAPTRPAESPAEEHRRGFLRRGATGAQPTTAAGRPRRPGDVRRGTNRRRRGSRSARSEGPERKGSGRPPSVAGACAQPAASGKARGRAGEDRYQLRMGSAGTRSRTGR